MKSTSIFALFACLIFFGSANAGIIEQNTWDNVTKSGWGYSGLGSGIIDAASGTPNAPNAIRFTYAAGMSGGVGTGKVEFPFTPVTDYYYGYWVKVSDNFEWHPVLQKLSFTWIATSSGPNCIHDGISYGGVTHGGGAGDIGRQKFIVRTGSLGASGDALWGANTGVSPTIETGKWYWIEVHAQMNTAGAQNGLLEAWINNQLIMRHRTVYFGSTAAAGFYDFMLSATYGGMGYTKTRTDYLWFDNTVISTTPIGMPGGTPPLSNVVVITTASLPSGASGQAYSAALTADGTAPYTWSIASGSLPAGLTLNALTGAITGTPASGGRSDFTVRVADAAKATATKSYTVVVSGSAGVDQDMATKELGGNLLITPSSNGALFSFASKIPGACVLTLFNSFGKKVWSAKSASGVLNTKANLAGQGVYFVQVEQNGKRMISRYSGTR